jgi:hypothetical protein
MNIKKNSILGHAVYWPSYCGAPVFFEVPYNASNEPRSQGHYVLGEVDRDAGCVGLSTLGSMLQLKSLLINVLSDDCAKQITKHSRSSQKALYEIKCPGTRVLFYADADKERPMCAPVTSSALSCEGQHNFWHEGYRGVGFLVNTHFGNNIDIDSIINNIENAIINTPQYKIIAICDKHNPKEKYYYNTGDVLAELYRRNRKAIDSMRTFNIGRLRAVMLPHKYVNHNSGNSIMFMFVSISPRLEIDLLVRP